MILKPVLIRLFRNSLWPSIRAQAKQDSYQKNTWEQVIKKAIIVEAKATLNLPSWVQEIDVCCPRSNQSSFKADKYTKEKVSIGILPSLRTLNPSSFNTLGTPRPRIGLGKTIKIISAIKEAVVIVVLAA